MPLTPGSLPHPSLWRTFPATSRHIVDERDPMWRKATGERDKRQDLGENLQDVDEGLAGLQRARGEWPNDSKRMSIIFKMLDAAPKRMAKRKVSRQRVPRAASDYSLEP